MRKQSVIILPLLLIIIFSCVNDGSKTLKKTTELNKSSTLKSDFVKPLGGGWVESIGIASYNNITPEEARKKAIINACISAIQYYGVEVSQRNLDYQAESNHKIIQDDFLSLTSQITHGVILDKEVIDEKIVNDGGNIEKIIKLRVKIGMQGGQKDPYFSLKASLNRDVFKMGDQLQASVTSTQDCYLTIMNISDDAVYILFPNKYCGDNYIKKGQKFEFPNDDHKKMGISIPAILLKGQDKDIGVIKILATKKETSFERLCNQSQYGTYEFALHDLLNLLIKIPLNEIEEADLPYIITL